MEKARFVSSGCKQQPYPAPVTDGRDAGVSQRGARRPAAGQRRFNQEEQPSEFSVPKYVFVKIRL